MVKPLADLRSNRAAVQATNDDASTNKLYDEGKAPYLYVELDFIEVTSKKTALIETYSQLRDKVGETASISSEKGEVHSDHCKLLPVDLCNIENLNDIIAQANLDTRIERLEIFDEFDEWYMMQGLLKKFGFPNTQPTTNTIHIEKDNPNRI